MPAISFFADDRDVHLLVDRLNADPEVAFIGHILEHRRMSRPHSRGCWVIHLLLDASQSQ